MLLLYGWLLQSEGEARDESHANETFHSIFVVAKELFAAFNSLAVYSYSKSPTMEHKYIDSRTKIFDEFKVLRKNLAGHPEQLKQLDKTERLEMRTVKICDGIYDAVHEADTDLMTVMNIRGMRNQLDALLDQTIAELKALNESVQAKTGSKSEAALKWRANAKLILLWGVGANIALSVLFVLYFTRAITDRLKVLMTNANRLADAKPLLPAIKGDDEIAELDEVFHQMAETIEESKRKQKALVDNAVDVICSIDKNDVFTMVSPASEKVWGYKDSELVGKSLADIIVEDDIEETLNCLETIKKVESTVPVENRVRCPDGKIINVLWSVFWSESEETLYCVAHDITARKMVERVLAESEQRTRAMMEGLPVGLIVINKTGKIQLANKKTEEMFGIRREDFAGRNLASLLRSEDNVASLLRTDDNVASPEWMQELITSTSGHVVELVGVRADGSTFPVELSSSETMVTERQLHLVALLDVSERHEIERLKREFVAMVSHDLKTPLSSVRGMLVLLSEGAAGELPPKAGPIVRSAEGQLERLITMINDLLDVQKMESGKFRIEAENVSIRALMEQSFDTVEQFADEHKVSIEISGGDARVLADPDRILQVLINLLSNAIKFSPENSTVSLRLVSNNEEFVEVRVEDEGRGIKKEFQSTIFERFKQVDKEDATEKKGSGLGLAICKMIVEGHNGEIGVDSTEGEGSTFWFRLPRVSEV